MNDDVRIYVDQRAVTAAGTPERINEEATNVWGRKLLSVTIRANNGNAGLVYVAYKDLLATITTDGYILTAGETVTIDVHDIIGSYIDLYNWYVDAANSGDGISYVGIPEV